MNRMKRIGVPIDDLIDQLRGVTAQKLVRVFCVSCHGDGCDDCHQTGFGNRTLLSESVYFAKSSQAKSAANGEIWWQTMRQHAEQKIQEGLTNQAEVSRVLGN